MRRRSLLLLSLAVLCLGAVGFSSASFSAGSDNAANTFGTAADFVAPVVTLTGPADGATTDGTPTFSGTAGSASGDSDTVRVDVYSGSTATGTPVETLTTTASGGAYSVDSAGLAEGTYTARAQQDDNGANTGLSSPVTFTVDTTAPALSLTAPADGTRTGDSTPSFSGSTDDAHDVRVKVYSGSTVAGSPVQTLTATVSGGSYSVDASSLGDGTYTARAEQDDSVGNTGFSFPTTFTVDTTAPTGVTVTTPAHNSSTNDTTPTLSGAAGDAVGDNGSVSVKVYSGTGTGGAVVQTLSAPRTGASWTVDASALAAGTYTVQATQGDAAGNTSTASNANTFVVDTTAPSGLTMTTPPANTNDTTPTFSGAAGNATGDSTGVTVRVYSGSDTNGTLVQTRTATRSGTAWTIDASPALAEGTYTAQAEQTDAAGNSSLSTARTFNVDTTGPAPTVTFPATSTRVNDSTPTFTGTAGDATGDNSTLTVKVYFGTGTGGTVVQTLTATRSGTAWSVTSGPLTNGSTYTVQATQGDAAGNAGTASNANTFVVDTSAPTGVTVTSPANNSFTSDTTPTFSGGAGTATGDDTTLTVKVYNGTGTGGTVNQTLTPTRSGNSWTIGASTLAEGTYTVQATQGDSAGNSSNSTANTFTVDTTAPAGVTLTSPADGATINDATPTLTGAAGNAPGDSTSVAVKIYNGTGTGGTVAKSFNATRAGAAWSGTSTSLTDGTYTAQVTQSDSAGNTSAVSNANTFTVDSTSPTVTATVASTSSGTPVGSGGFVAPSGTYVVYANASDAGSGLTGTVTANVANITTGQTAVALTFDATGVSVGGTTYHYVSAEKTANSGLSSGNKSYTVSAPDSAGNTGTFTGNAVSDTSAPSNSLANPGSFIGGTISLDSTASDSSSGIASVVVQRSPAGAGTWTTVCTDTSSPYSCSLDTTTLTDGALYDLRSIATNNAGLATTSTQSNKRVDNTAPTLTGFTVPAAPLSGSVTLSATSTDSGANSSGVGGVTFEVSPAGAGTWTTACSDSSSPYSCSYSTTALTNGSYDFRAVSTDNAGNTTTAATVTRSVDQPHGSDIQANTGGNNTVGAGDSLTYTFDEAVSPSSIVSGWNGSAMTVTVRLNSAGSNDSMTLYDSANTNQLGIGTVLTGGSYIGGATCNYYRWSSSSMVMSGSTVTVTLGGTPTASGGCTLSAGGTNHDLSWTPVNTIKNPAGASLVVATVNESNHDTDF